MFTTLERHSGKRQNRMIKVVSRQVGFRQAQMHISQVMRYFPMFYIPGYLTSFGVVILRIMASIAAGTIPEPPKIYLSHWGMNA